MLRVAPIITGIAALCVLVSPAAASASEGRQAASIPHIHAPAVFHIAAPTLHETHPRHGDPWSSAETAPPAADQTRPAEPDFFFGRPHFTVTLRGGAFLPRARGQFYEEYAFERFTLDRGDLTSFTGGMDLGIWAGERIEIFGSLDLASVTRDSEYRDWEEITDAGPLPIRQTTRLRTGPILSLGAKVYPLPRGEQLGQFIWVPSNVAPYLSGGIGGMGYEVEQWGDWVVEVGENMGDIFTDEFSHADATFITFIGAGTDISLRRSLSLNLDARYISGEDRLTGDFGEFDRPLDLSGLRLTAGLSYRL